MDSVVIVRARHPLEGRSLRWLGQMRRHGRVELLVVLPDGSKSLIPAEWTDRVTPAEEASAPATVATLADLAQAVALVAELLAREAGPEVQAAGHPPPEEDAHAACTAQFAAGPGAGATHGPSRPAARATGRGRDRGAGPDDRPRRDGDERGGRR